MSQSKKSQIIPGGPRPLLQLGLAMLVSACGILETKTPDGFFTNLPTYEEYPLAEILNSGASGKVDILFMIDNSGSMGDDQEALAAAATAFENVVTAADVCWAVGTTDLYRDPTPSADFNGRTHCSSLSDNSAQTISKLQDHLFVGEEGNPTEQSPLSIFWGLLGMGFDWYQDTFALPTNPLFRQNSLLAYFIMSDEAYQQPEFDIPHPTSAGSIPRSEFGPTEFAGGMVDFARNMRTANDDPNTLLAVARNITQDSAPYTYGFSNVDPIENGYPDLVTAFQAKTNVESGLLFNITDDGGNTADSFSSIAAAFSSQIENQLNLTYDFTSQSPIQIGTLIIQIVNNQGSVLTDVPSNAYTIAGADNREIALNQEWVDNFAQGQDPAQLSGAALRLLYTPETLN